MEQTPEQKAAEFDASHANPAQYAAQNFPSGQSNGEQYETARAIQIEQQRSK